MGYTRCLVFLFDWEMHKWFTHSHVLCLKSETKEHCLVFEEKYTMVVAQCLTSRFIFISIPAKSYNIQINIYFHCMHM